MEIIELQESLVKFKERLILVLDPKTVKLQVKEIILIQKELRELKQIISSRLIEIKANPNLYITDEIPRVILDKDCQRKRASKKKEGKTEDKLSLRVAITNLRKPYLDAKTEIDRLHLEGDRLKLKAKKYISDLNDLLSQFGEYKGKNTKKGKNE